MENKNRAKCIKYPAALDSVILPSPSHIMSTYLVAIEPEDRFALSSFSAFFIQAQF